MGPAVPPRPLPVVFLLKFLCPSPHTLYVVDTFNVSINTETDRQEAVPGEGIMQDKVLRSKVQNGVIPNNPAQARDKYAAAFTEFPGLSINSLSKGGWSMLKTVILLFCITQFYLSLAQGLKTCDCPLNSRSEYNLSPPYYLDSKPSGNLRSAASSSLQKEHSLRVINNDYWKTQASLFIFGLHGSF